PRGIDSTEDSITVTWNKPTHDGGSPITGYVLEKRHISEDKWTRATHSTCPDLVCRVPNLIENYEYEFRVAAVNAAGQGPWSSSSDGIFCRRPPHAPRITSDLHIRDITVIAGEEFRITVPYTANPIPKASWTINGSEVTPDDNIKFETDSITSVFHNKCAKRNQSGTYSIYLENSEGKDSASCHVTVVDRPSPPQGPMCAFDITPETCTLTWKTPLDDGGSPITNYVVEKQDGNGVWVKVSSFVRRPTYDMMGLEPNRKYYFRVRAENQYGLSDPLTMDEPVIAKHQFTVPDAPGAPRVTDWDSGNVTLIWERPLSDGGSRILDTKYQLFNLPKGNEYVFRVKAKNAAGYGKPSLPSSKFKLKGKFNVPTPPGQPQVIKVGKNYVDLKWEPPRSDGGSRITGYIVEKRDVGGAIWVKCNDYNVLETEYTVINLAEMGSPITGYIIEMKPKFGTWQKAIDVPADTTAATVPGLTEGEEYEFRVIAVNKGGPGEPSDPSQSVIAKPRFIAPTIPGNALKDLIVHAGKPIGWRIPLDASPRPKVTWLFHGKKLEPSNRVDSNFFQNELTFEIPFSLRSDSGRYTLELENEVGRCSASANVTVLDKPSPPKAPLNISNINKNGCHLSWGLPEDDGGSPILHYVIEKMDLSRGTWSDAEHSAKNEFDEPGAPGKPAITDWDKDHVDLEWTRPKSDGGAPIKEYIIQKKEKGSPYWVNAVHVPGDKTSGTVPELIEGQEYEFHNDIQTLRNVKECNWGFDEESFRFISEEGKDFIQRLLLANREKRMTAHECLLHPWLTGDHSDRTQEINRQRFLQWRDRIRKQYEDFARYLCPIGRLSEYSSLRKLLIEKYKIIETTIDRRQAAPRFVIRPTSQFCYEGQSIKFYCRVIGAATPTLSWFRNNCELRQSVKFMKRYSGDDYYFIINRVKLDDRGEYVIRAENTYGAREEVVFLMFNHCQRKFLAHHVPNKPHHLESRYVNDGEAVTLACRITGSDLFDVVWLHDNKEIKPSKDFEYSNEANIYKLTIAEIFPEDSGTYTCEAFNDVGESFSTCTINVIVPGDESKLPKFKKQPSSSTVQVSESTTFECELDEAPKSVSWLKDGSVIDVNNARYTFQQDNNKYVFQIKNTILEDFGQYQVQVVGKSGEIFSSFSLNVFP
uniref:Twitchin n=1 Tax=Megaselia scalaris TaxID=36166 RepID=T1GA95_MEGSC